jgi:hypothetical protein
MHISQRDMAERGHSLESIKASIRARKPDFDAYIGMQSMCFVPYLLPAQCSHAGIIESQTQVLGIFSVPGYHWQKCA